MRVSCDSEDLWLVRRLQRYFASVGLLELRTPLCSNNVAKGCERLVFTNCQGVELRRVVFNARVGHVVFEGAGAAFTIQ